LKIVLGVLWFILLEAGLASAGFSFDASWLEWAVFGFFSMYAVLLALYLALWTVDATDVACHALIGRTRYLFLDQKGSLHVHRENPVHAWAHTASSDNWSWETYLLHYRIFQVRSGGIFRKCKVIANGGTSWKLSVGIFDDRIHVIDKFGARFVVSRELESWPGHLVTERDRLKQALRFVVKYARLNAVLTTLDKHEEIDQAFDALGIECTELIHLMEVSKQTMGRSKHAQLLRERLEAVFKKLPAQRVKSWAHSVAKDKTELEEAAKAV
jgi:hypothetical protein